MSKIICILGLVKRLFYKDFAMRNADNNIKTYDINDVADYIILQATAEETHPSLTNLKLQKLLYYVQAWSYGIHQRPFFSENEQFQAWIHGPVNRTIYDRFEPTKLLYSELTMSDRRQDAKDLDDEGKEFVDFILENYMKFTGVQLEAMTHREDPWIQAREGIAPTARCEKIISPDAMVKFYGKRWKEIQG